MSFPEAPMLSSIARPTPDAGELWRWRGRTYRWGDDRPVGGPMASFVGRRYTAAELTSACEWHEPHMPLVRAYPVPGLEGVSFSSPGQQDLARALCTLLRTHCPGIDWQVEEVSCEPVQKYLIVHTTVPAPPDATTGQPMALELYASVRRVGTHDLSGPDGEKWQEKRRAEQFGSPRTDSATSRPRYAPLQGELGLVLVTATYANVLFPGIGVPFYL